MQRKKQRPPDQHAPEVQPALDFAAPRKQEAEPSGAEDDAAGCGSPSAPSAAPAGVVFAHGIHQVHLPAEGLTITQVRATLQPLLNIGPDTVAVVRGQTIENPDEFVISEGVELVSFVKPSSVKGIARRGERVELQSGTTTLHLERSKRELPTEAVIATIQRSAITGMHEEALPSTVRWRVNCDSTSIFVLEFEPEIRSLNWIDPKSPAPYGAHAKYTRYRLATPYVVMKVAFRDGQLYPTAELFYRNAPLRTLDDSLGWPNLLNVSPNSYDVTAWVCTQFLGAELAEFVARVGRAATMVEQIDVLHRHLWWGGFNRSSEEHEGQSCFSKAKEDKLDERVVDVERWQEETDKDWRFILDVEWIPTEHTVRSLLNAQLAQFDQPVDLSDAKELTNVLLPRDARRKKGA